ncbi:MAG: response regulator [Deltaproteobacteria bacterium]|nr:response regulator [Deltaproteobacteria bacterium]
MKKVLIVDDTRLGLAILREILERPSLQLLEATSGAEALEIHRREKADLIIMDLHMPGMEGDEVASVIRSDPSIRGVSIIMFSGSAREETRQRCLAAGANDFVAKPFQGGELMSRVLRHVDVAVRKAARLLAHVEVRGDGVAPLTFLGRTVNLSTSGLLLETDASLEVGRELLLTFFVPGTRTQLQARAEVVRKATGGGAARWGVRFITLDQAGRRALFDYFEAAGSGTT